MLQRADRLMYRLESISFVPINLPASEYSQSSENEFMQESELDTEQL